MPSKYKKIFLHKYEKIFVATKSDINKKKKRKNFFLSRNWQKFVFAVTLFAYSCRLLCHCYSYRLKPFPLPPFLFPSHCFWLNQISVVYTLKATCLTEYLPKHTSGFIRFVHPAYFSSKSFAPSGRDWQTYISLCTDKTWHSFLVSGMPMSCKVAVGVSALYSSDWLNWNRKKKRNVFVPNEMIAGVLSLGVNP